MLAAGGVVPQRGWSASLELGFGAVGGRTVLERRRHHGPLQVQRVFYPEGPEVAHVYVLHPPGGVVGGDELAVDASTAPGARALLTTPAATKLYRSAGRRAAVQTVLTVKAGSVLEWLPAETLAFNGALASLSTRVEVEPSAVFMGWEVLALGRPAAGERFGAGKLVQRFELWSGAQPLFVERGRYDGGGPVLDQRWGLGGYATCGTLAAFPAAESELRAARAASMAGGELSVTLLGSVLVARVLSRGTYEARAALEQVWRILRPELTGRAACDPRIWKT